MRGLVALLVALSPLAAQRPFVELTRVASGVPAPTDIQNAGDGSGRLFLVQQNGIVRILRNGALLPEVFLDIRSRTRGSGERGLLGLAFPPGFARKQYFYVNYTNLAGDTVIARYRVTPDPDVADPGSETVLLTIRQPFANHNGGQIQFGPDGFLWIGTGDGGSGGDPQNHGQNPHSLLGKMLRYDSESDLVRLLIPSGNPFASDASALPPVWALGLRNPWRFSFDRKTGDLWIADVGQNRAEEVNFQPASSRGGENYGWNPVEGLECFLPGCSPAGFSAPVLEYGRDGGCSVTGGYVYRGRGSPGLAGTYLYADFCSGRIWGVRREGGAWVNRLLLDSRKPVSTFGEDEAGEVYLADHRAGEIFRIAGRNVPLFEPLSVVDAASLRQGIAAGSAATIFASGVTETEAVIAASRVPLPTTLDGVTVTVNEILAPLFAVANLEGVEQINFQVPFEVAPSGRARIVVTRNGLASPPVEVDLSVFRPGIFALNGRDGIVVRHGDNSLVSPARPIGSGESVYFYATGLGPVANPPVTGSPGPRNPLAATLTTPRVTLDGVPCDVLYSGLAPDLVGVYQVNVRVPSLPAGLAELVIAAGDASSPAVRVPVR